jgi:PAS domain S-box-containing protein
MRRAGGLIPAFLLAFLLAFAYLPAAVPRESIRVVMDDAYPPFIFRAADGTLQGILVDQWALWEQKTGVRVRLEGMDWAQAQQRMAAGDFDVIDTIFKNDQRLASYAFTQPYARIDVPIFFSRELSGIRGPKDLAGFVVGAKRGDNSVNILRASGVNQIELFNNYQSLIEAARDGRIKVFTVDKPPAEYYLVKLGIQDLFRATEPLYSGQFHRAVAKGDDALLALVQRGFDAISRRDYQAIERHWYGAPVITRQDLTIAAKVAAASCGLLCLLLLWVWTLRRNVRQRTRELSASQAYIQTLFNSVSDAVFVADGEGRILDFNARAMEVFGLDREQLLARCMDDLGEGSRFNARLAAACREGTVLFEWSGRHSDGHLIPLEIAARFDETRVRGPFILAVRDITERKALRESEIRMKSISDNFVNGMFYQIIVDAQGRRKFSYLSDSVKHLYGVSPEAAQADPALIYGRIHEDDIEALTRAESESLAACTTFKIEARVKGPSGDVRWSSFISTPKKLADGCTCWDGIEFIITERKKAEREHAQLQAQLMQAQKMESLGTLAGGVAHDMNNVLGAILALASANLETQPAGSPARSAFGTIAQAAVRGGTMVKSLLSFARQSPAETREVDLNALLREQVELLERTTLSRVRLVLDLEQGLRPIRGDASALSHSLMNLCVNAVDAMGDGGALTLRTRNLDPDQVEVQVEDTGCGMTRDVQARALDPFYTTKAQGKGTGLGLSLVYSTVKAHQGHLEIQSIPGLGTRVSLSFPALAATAPLPDSGRQTFPEACAKGLRVLLVDDDELIRSAMQEVLECLGHCVLAVMSGEEALGHLEAFQPDVVILDMNMPGLGGAGTLPLLQLMAPSLPVILATGRPDQAVLDLIEQRARVSLLSKPFSMCELQRHLERVGQV